MNSPEPCRRRCSSAACAPRLAARRGREHHHDDVGERVERHRDQAERDELQRRVAAGRIDELRNEGEEEGCGLGIERLDQDAVAKRPRWRRPGSTLRPADRRAFAKGPDAEPDQIERAGQFERREQLRAGKDDRGDAEAARDDMDESAERRARASRRCRLAAARQRPRRDVENAGAGDAAMTRAAAGTAEDLRRPSPPDRQCDRARQNATTCSSAVFIGEAGNSASASTAIAP